jgi:hypothetical protein
MADAHKYQAHEVLNRVLNAGEDGLNVDLADSVTVTVDSEFPAAAAITDNFANPTTTSAMSMLMGYDGSAWDRVTIGGGTEAAALRVTIASDSTGVVSVDDGGGALTVDGTVTANLGTTDNAVLDAIAASLAVLGDWDDSNYANVNANIAGTDIVGGAGAVASGVQRVTLASDDPAVTSLGNLDNAVDGNYLNVNMNLAGSDAQAGEGTISATTQRVTIATDDDGVAHLATIAGAVSTQMQVDVVGSLPAGSAAIGKLAANSGVDIGDVDVTSLPASTNTIEVVGDAAEDANAAGNPVLVGGRYDAPGNDNSSLRSLDDTDVGALALDPTGAAYVREHLGQSGSCFVSGTAAVTAAYGKFVAIQFLEDTVFNSTDGLVATDGGRWPDDSAAASDVSSSNTAAVGSQSFPQGMTIFGRWDSFILASGAVIAYVGNV